MLHTIVRLATYNDINRSLLICSCVAANLYLYITFLFHFTYSTFLFSNVTALISTVRLTRKAHTHISKLRRLQHQCLMTFPRSRSIPFAVPEIGVGFRRFAHVGSMRVICLWIPLCCREHWLLNDARR